MGARFGKRRAGREHHLRARGPAVRSLGLLLVLAACDGEEPRRIRLAVNPGTGDGGRGAAVLRVSTPQQKTIAIRSFENATGDTGLDWLRRGLTDMLVTDLGQSPYLNVLSPARLDELAAASHSGVRAVSRDGAATPASAGKGSLAGLVPQGTVLEGRYYKEGADLVIDAELRDIATGATLRREEVRGPGLDRVFLMVSDLSKRVRNNLRAEPASGVEGDLEVGEMTESVEAFRHYSRGLESLEKLLMADADREFEAAIQADPAFAAAHLRRVLAKQGIGDNEAALRSLELARQHALKLSKSDAVLLRLREAQFDGDVDRIRAIGEELERMAPQDVDARVETAHVLFGMKEFDRALERLEALLEEDPKRKMLYNQLGYIYADRGDFTTALKTLERYRELTPGEPNAHDSIGEILLLAGRIDESAEHFKRALSRRPDFYYSAAHLSQVYSELGDLKTALEYSDRRLASAPSPKEEGTAWTDRALLLWRFGRIAEATKSFKEAKDAAPDLVKPLWFQSMLRRAIGDAAGSEKLERACFDVHRSLVAEPSRRHPEVGTFVAFCMASSLPPGELLPALEEAGRNVRYRTLSDLIGLYRGVLLLRAGDVGEGREALAAGGAAAVVRLIGSRNLERGSMWKYLVEAIDRCGRGAPSQPRETSPGFDLARRALEAAAKTGRKDAEVMARLLQAQIDARDGRITEAKASYGALGVPLEEDWRVIGPFPNVSGFQRPFPPESAVDPKGRIESGGKTLHWEPAGDGVYDGYVDLRRVLGEPSWAVAYGALGIDSPDARVVQIRMGANEACKVWVNDELVWQAYRVSEAPLDHDLVKVVLRPGENRLLVKVTNTIGDWGFYLRVTDEKGDGLPDLGFHPPSLSQSARSRPGLPAAGAPGAGT